MAIKSTTSKHQYGKPFPKLGVQKTGVVVLFSSEGRGVVVANPSIAPSRYIGYYSNSWIMGEFSDYLAEVTLVNK